jgi:hypothetical protein
MIPLRPVQTERWIPRRGARIGLMLMMGTWLLTRHLSRSQRLR